MDANGETAQNGDFSRRTRNTGKQEKGQTGGERGVSACFPVFPVFLFGLWADLIHPRAGGRGNPNIQ
jgi:hypothetical protein